MLLRYWCVSLAALLVLARGSGASHAAVLRFRLDARASRVTVAVTEPLAVVRGEAVGRLRVREGEVEGDPADLEHSARVRVVVEAGSYESGNGMRDRAVRTKALEAERYPEIVFLGGRVALVPGGSTRPLGGGGRALARERVASLRINGMLTLHGTTRPLSVLVKVWLDRAGRLHAEGAFPVRLADYGVPRLRLLRLFPTGKTASVHFMLIGMPER